MLTSPLVEDSALQRQLEREKRSVQVGIKRYYDGVDDSIARGKGSEVSAVQRLMIHWHRVLVFKTRDRIEKFAKTGFTDRSTINALAMLVLAKPEESAYLAIRVTMNFLLAKGDYNRNQLAYQIGLAVASHINGHKWSESDPEGWRAIRDRMHNISPQYVQRNAKKSVPDAIYGYRACIEAGRTLLDDLTVMASCRDYRKEGFGEPDFVPAFDCKQRFGLNRHNDIYIQLTPDALELINEGHEKRMVLRPAMWPMVCPPSPWKDNRGGGYYTIQRAIVFQAPSIVTEQLRADPCPTMDAMCNLAGSVPLAVNDGVYDVASKLWDRGGGVGGQPLKTMPLPEPPEGFDAQAPRGHRWDGVDKAVKDQWIAERSNARRAARMAAGKQHAYSTAMSMAGELKHEQHFHVPHRACFRGRIYPFCEYLHYHEGDTVRGLLQMGEPVPLGRDGERWIKIHAAGCFGVDKVSIADRIAWVDEHAADIERSAANPMGYRWWADASEPWQFLASCYALTDSRAAQRLIVKMDGSCNGLQHFSAMLRDEVGGALVNLVPGDKPADAYSAVLDVFEQRVATDSYPMTLKLSGGKTVSLDAAVCAREILATMSRKQRRKCVKTPVMTKYYGVTLAGAKIQVMEVLVEFGFDSRDPKVRAARAYIAKRVLEIANEMVPGATRAMDWIGNYAAAIAKAGHHPMWTAPSGWKVRKYYGKWHSTMAKTPFGNLRYYDNTHPPRRVPPKKLRQATPANVVHSIDAAHLYLIQRRGAREGVAVVPVHDAFGTHAGHAGSLHENVLSSFVDLHRNDLLANLEDQWRAAYPDVSAPTRPAHGTLDIEAVYRSHYAFL